MRRSPPFRQRDLSRAIRAVEATGLAVGRIEISKDGKIAVVPAGGSGALTRSGAELRLDEAGPPK